MLYTNRHRNTALLLRTKRNGTAVLCPIAAGALTTIEVSKSDLASAWAPLPYPLPQAIARFMRHLEKHGGTKEAETGLRKLDEVINPPVLTTYDREELLRRETLRKEAEKQEARESCRARIQEEAQPFVLVGSRRAADVARQLHLF